MTSSFPNSKNNSKYIKNLNENFKGDANNNAKPSEQMTPNFGNPKDDRNYNKSSKIMLTIIQNI